VEKYIYGSYKGLWRPMKYAELLRTHFENICTATRRAFDEFV
jgi:hypothetical protein